MPEARVHPVSIQSALLSREVELCCSSGHSGRFHHTLLGWPEPACRGASVPCVELRCRQNEEATGIPVASLGSAFAWPAYSGPGTVKLSGLDSFLPSSVQIAPSALQSVVSGRVMVMVPFPSGFTVMRQEMLLGLSVLWAASTDPPVTLKAWSPAG